MSSHKHIPQLVKVVVVFFPSFLILFPFLGMAQAIEDVRIAERKAERDVFKGFGAILESFGSSLSDWVQNLVETMATQLNTAQSQLAVMQQRCQRAENDLAESQKNAQAEIEDMRKNMLEAEAKANTQVADIRQKLAERLDTEALQLQLQHERDTLNETQKTQLAALRTQNDDLQLQVETLQARDKKRKQSVMQMLQNFEVSLGEEDFTPKRQRTETVAQLEPSAGEPF